MFGIPADSYSGTAEDFRRSVHPEDRELVWKAVADARESRRPYIAEFRIVRTDGDRAMGHCQGKILLREEWRCRADAGHGSGHY